MEKLPDMIRIESDHWRLWCNPDRGVEWLAAEVQRQQQWQAVVPDCRETVPAESLVNGLPAGQALDAPLPAASFHMLPYSNRIRDGRFQFEQETIQLAHGDVHAIHGALRKLPWRVLSSDASSLRCAISSTDHDGLNWPWAFDAEITHRIEGDTLSSTLVMSNRDTRNMPAGFGWHPYFVRQVAGAQPILTLPVETVFPDENGDCLPDGPAVPLPVELDFRQARALDPDQRIDCCMAGLNGNCVIDWQEAGIRLHMTADEICRYLILYNPDMPHFAVEPVTNANDAFNLSHQGIDSGMQVLSPGESLEATMSLRLETS
ncbi:aldose epimerase family protein [Granulosicoccus sp. 3-233]|uniref:aldose epimerase family protein n=1 Tax=Granulosicoccus sp. 3-233 TaxID=3417969 RepID=UPI003D329C6E